MRAEAMMLVKKLCECDGYTFLGELDLALARFFNIPHFPDKAAFQDNVVLHPVLQNKPSFSLVPNGDFTTNHKTAMQLLPEIDVTLNITTPRDEDWVVLDVNLNNKEEGISLQIIANSIPLAICSAAIILHERFSVEQSVNQVSGEVVANV